MNGTPIAQGAASACAAAERCAKSGPKTSGPQIAPETAPKRTNDMPRARRSGGNISAAAARDSCTTAPEPPTIARPRQTRNADDAEQPAAMTAQPIAPPTNAPRMTGIRPTRSISRPAGPTASAPASEEDRRPEAEDPLDAGDGDERDGAERGRELERAGVRDEAAGEEERVPADVTPHNASVRRSPSANASAPPCDGCRTYGASSAVGGDAADGDRRGGRVSAPRGTGGQRRSRRASVGGSTPPSPDASARRSRAGRPPRRPSAASTRCTIVALASAGPEPVSWRSDVNGMPLTRAPR